jgi:hypothetical protein
MGRIVPAVVSVVCVWACGAPKSKEPVPVAPGASDNPDPIPPPMTQPAPPPKTLNPYFQPGSADPLASRMGWPGERVQVTLTPTGERGCDDLFPGQSVGSRSIHAFEGPSIGRTVVLDGKGNAAGPFGYIAKDGPGLPDASAIVKPVAVVGAFEDGGFAALTGRGGSYSVTRVAPDGTVLWQQPVGGFYLNVGPHGETVSSWQAADGIHYSVVASGGLVESPDVAAGAPGIGSDNLLGSADAAGNVLIVSSGVARWFDKAGKLLAELPVAAHAWRADPLLGGGFALFNFLDSGGWGFTALLPSGGASALPLPKALADHPDARLTMLAAGGYALYERPLFASPPAHGCALHVWSLTRDFHVCGEVAFTAATDQCGTAALAVGADGTVARLSSQELCEGGPFDSACTASARVWDRLLSASPAPGEPDAVQVPPALSPFDEGPPDVRIETNGCPELLAGSIPRAEFAAKSAWPAARDPLSLGDGKVVLAQFATDYSGNGTEWAWIEHYTVEKRDASGALMWGPVEVGAFGRGSCDACGPEHHVYAAGADISGAVLAYLDGNVRWLDRNGNVMTDWFAARRGNVFLLSDPVSFHAMPKGGIAARDDLWRLVFRPFSTTPDQLPDWLAERPESDLALVSNGAAIAAWRSSGYVARCEQRVEIVRDDAVCASVTFSSGAQPCRLPSLTVEPDGSVVRRSVLQSVSSDQQPLVQRTWPQLLR